MRSDFSVGFAAEILKPSALPFWTTVFHFPTGDVYISGRAAIISGNAHTLILADLSAIASGSGRGEPTQMAVPNCDLAFVNMPYPSGAPGQLAINERLIDRYTRTTQNVLADIYLSLELDDHSIVQALMFPGVLQVPSVGYLLGSQRVSSRGERYLNASVHRTLSSVTYPYIRTADVRQTVPIVIGSVPKCPGRVVKARRASNPVADPDNTGNAILGAITVNDGAIAEDWTITFTSPETVEFTTTPDSDQPLNVTSITAHPVRAQSFQLAQAELLTSVTVKLKNTTYYHAYVLEIWTDSGGNPGVRVATAARIGQYVPPSTTYVERSFSFPRIPLNGSTMYWLVAYGQNTSSGTTAPGDVLYMGAKTTGGYAGGKAKAGTMGWNSFSTDADFWAFTVTTGMITWTSALDAYDFWFRLGFGADAFSAVGSITGTDGAGGPTADFTSTSEAITIPATSWQGSPEAGDVFTFSVDPAASVAIFSESPAATPIGSITSVYYGDTRIETGTTVTHEPGFGAEQSFGDTVRRAMAQAIPITGTQSFKRIGFQIRKLGTPSSPVRFQVRRELDGFPSEVILASVEVPATDLETTPATPAMLYKDIPLVSGTNETLWLMIDTDQSDASNLYLISEAVDDTALPGVTAQRLTSGVWDDWGFDLGCSLIAATVTSEESADDGTGSLVAKVSIDVEIPDDVSITADIDGIQDDTSGTYTGSPSSTLSIPGHVFHWLLIRAGVATADIDLAGSFSSSNAQYGTLYRFNGVSQADVTYKTLLLKLAYESRSVFGWMLKATLRFVPDTYPTPLRTFVLDDILTDANRVPQLSLTPMAMEEIINSLVANYNLEPAIGHYKSTLSRYSPDSAGAFGVLKRTDLENLDFVRSEAQARAIVDLRLRRQAFPAWRAAFTTLLPFLDMQEDDPVALNLTNAAAGGDVLGGWNGTQTFQIEAVNPQPSIFGLDFVLREANIVVNLLDGDPVLTGVQSIVVLRDQTTGDLIDVNFGAEPLTQTTPSVSGGTPFDAISLSGGYYVYVDNGLLSASNTVTPTTVLPWIGPPTLSIDGSGGLVVG